MGNVEVEKQTSPPWRVGAPFESTDPECALAITGTGGGSCTREKEGLKGTICSLPSQSHMPRINDEPIEASRPKSPFSRMRAWNVFKGLMIDHPHEKDVEKTHLMPSMAFYITQYFDKGLFETVFYIEGTSISRFIAICAIPKLAMYCPHIAEMMTGAHLLMIRRWHSVHMCFVKAHGPATRLSIINHFPSDISLQYATFCTRTR